jgi:hypothetical protein
MCLRSGLHAWLSSLTAQRKSEYPGPSPPGLLLVSSLCLDSSPPGKPSSGVTASEDDSCIQVFVNHLRGIGLDATLKFSGFLLGISRTLR